MAIRVHLQHASECVRYTEHLTHGRTLYFRLYGHEGVTVVVPSCRVQESGMTVSSSAPRVVYTEAVELVSRVSRRRLYRAPDVIRWLRRRWPDVWAMPNVQRQFLGEFDGWRIAALDVDPPHGRYLGAGRRLEGVGYPSGGRVDLACALRRASVAWAEVWQEDAETVGALDDAGYVHVATQVRASSELLGLYQRAPASYALPERVERRALTRLALVVSPSLFEAARVEVAALDGWAQHYSSYNIRKSWAALALVGYDAADPTFIIKPSEMSREWQRANADRAMAAPARTPLADRCPALMWLASTVPGEKERVRVMRVAPGGGLARHADITNRDAGVTEGKVARLHLPVVTHPSVQFQSWDDTGRRRTGHLQAGRWYYLDQRKPHAVTAAGADIARVHLVVDVLSTSWLREGLALGEEIGDNAG